MRLNRWFRRAAGLSLVCASVVAVAPLSGSVAPIVSAQAVDAGGEFHALTPTRILDTRPASAVGGLTGAKKLVLEPRKDKSGEFSFNVLGKGGLPTNADEILAVVANITVTQPSSSGYVAVFPSGFDFGGPADNAESPSLLNFTAGADVPNLAIVGVDDAGSFSITGKGNPAGNYHVIVDVLGFVSTSQYATGGARLELVEPGRIMDSRASGGPIAARTSRTLQVRGADTLPSVQKPSTVPDIVPNRDSVTAVLVNLTLVNNRADSAPTHVTATPNAITAAQGSKNPSSSNAPSARIKANMTVVPIAANGTISLYNNSGKLDLVVDVLGYFEEGVYATSNKGRVVPLDAPFRAFDTREKAFGDAQLQHGSEEEWSFDNFVKSVVLNPGASNEAGCPAQCVQQQGLIGSLVAIDLQPLFAAHAGQGYSSYLKLTPADADPAEVSNVNFFLGEVIPNMSLIKYGASGSDPHVVKAYNHYGQIDYLLDVYAIVLDE